MFIDCVSLLWVIENGGLNVSTVLLAFLLLSSLMEGVIIVLLLLMLMR
jgi:hypothetical protein